MNKLSITDVSIVIPFLDEAESLPELYEQIMEVVLKSAWSYEIIFVDDGSHDDGWDFVRSISKTNPFIKGIKFTRNYGKSQALHVGFELAQGEVVFTMDADLQDNPHELPVLYNKLINENLDIVSGWKKIRHDPLFGKTIPSKFFN